LNIMGLPEGVALPLIINEVHAHTTIHEKHERINRNIFFIYYLLNLLVRQLISNQDAQVFLLDLERM
jgi:hypothetical protein